MVKYIKRLQDLDFSMLMHVYEETNLEFGGAFGQLEAEQAFYQYLRDVFFRTDGAFYAVWIEADCYVCALRIEPYRNGYILAGLETMPSKRCEGYATMLVKAVAEHLLEELPNTIIYAHIKKNNLPSQRVHIRCGFQKTADSAAYIDGSVSSDAYTFCYRKDLV